MTEPSKLGIIAGKGALPAHIVAACERANRPYVILALDDSTDPALLSAHPHIRSRLGAIGHALGALREAGVQALVMAGHMQRPSLANLRPDMTATRLLARLGTKFFAGDDALLSEIVRFLEEEGFTVIGADSVLQDFLAKPGPLGHHHPSADDLRDITLGLSEAKTLGARDVGQAVIVANGEVLGHETAAGTDALIAEIAEKIARNATNQTSPNQPSEKQGILVKAKKPQQERRADLPSIGVTTVERAAEAGLRGIAVEAGHALIIAPEAVAARADALGLFVVGIDTDRAAAGEP